jgi:tetratricopeptide (TPR) repeat protein
VFFNDGDVVELGERSALTVGARRTAAGRPELPGEVYAQVSRFVTAGSRDEGLVAVTQMRGTEATAFLLSPRKTSVLSPRPTFAWRAVPGATRYLLTLSGEAGELWTQTVRDTACAFPEGAADLAADADYLWEVEARSETAVRQRESSVFHVVAAATAETVRADLAGIERGLGAGSAAGHYVAGSYLSGRGLYQDAIDRFLALSRLRPESPDPHEALGSVYRAVGLADAAAAEFQQALALAKSP